MTALVRREGEVLFDRISLRPGKAITFGLLGGKPYLGLSGNPAAAYVGFEMLARPAIRKMRGFAEGARPVQQAVLTHGVKKRQDRRFYDRATVARDTQTGELTVTEAHSQNSALLGTMQRANCLLRINEVRAILSRATSWMSSVSICPRAPCCRRNAMELKISIVTCSDTRDLAQDEAGAVLEELIAAQGWMVASHTVCMTMLTRSVLPLWLRPTIARPTCHHLRRHGAFDARRDARGDACRLRPRCAGYCRGDPCILYDQDAPCHAFARRVHAAWGCACHQLSGIHEGGSRKLGGRERPAGARGPHDGGRWTRSLNCLPVAE